MATTCTTASASHACRCGHVLVGTSLALLLPALLTHDPAFRAAVLCLVLTSVVFHATHALWAKAVDMCCVRVLFLWAVLRARRARSLALLAALVAGMVLLCIRFHPHTYEDGLQRVEWHAAMHAVGAAGLCAVA